MNFFPNIRADLRAYDGDLLAQGFWVMIVYRFGRWRYTIDSSLVRKPFSLLYKLLFKMIQILTGVELPCEVEIGKNFRIEHFHFANPAATVAMIASVYGTMEFSMSVHGPDIFYNVDTGLLKEKVCRAVFVRCISYYSRSQLMRLVDHDMWDRFHIVRCGIDPEVFAPRPVPQNDIPEILCVGRLVPAKGQHVLLDACSILNKQGVPFHLTYVGDGDDRLSLEKLTGGLGLADRVTLTGAVGQDDVHQYYDRADLFVLASFAEGVPVVLMEAMAKQIACISTRITGIPELIEDGTDGALAAPSDAEDLAARLKLLLENGSLRHDLGRKGREKVLAHYDLAANCRIMAQVFDMYLGNGKK